MPLVVQLLQCKILNIYNKQLRFFFFFQEHFTVFQLLKAFGVFFEPNASHGLVRGGMNTERVQKRTSHQHATVWFVRHTITCYLSLSVFFSSAAEETQRILNVLRSHETPFVKKRQVMNHVFGDYRPKMAEDQKSTEKAGELELSLWGMGGIWFFSGDVLRAGF